MILDVGSGKGAVGFDLLRRCPGATLVGVDVDGSILREAARKAPPGASCAFARADTFSLPFHVGTFDVVACQYLLQHLADSVGALVEMKRVTRAAGKVAVFEWDDGVNFSHPALPEPLGKLFRAKATLVQRMGGDRFIGRKLYHLLCAAGWADVQLRIVHDIWQGSADREAELYGTELSMREIKSQLLSEELLSEDEFEAAIRQLYEYYCGDVFSVVFYFAAFGTKRR